MDDTIFTRDFIARLALKDEPPWAAEAAAAGPYTVRRGPEGLWSVVPLGAGPGRSVADLVTYEAALMAAAIYPGLGREPLVRLRTEEGLHLETPDGGFLGRVHDEREPERLATALHDVECLLRQPLCLTFLLQAASGETLARAGELIERWREPEPPWPAWAG